MKPRIHSRGWQADVMPDPAASRDIRARLRSEARAAMREAGMARLPRHPFTEDGKALAEQDAEAIRSALRRQGLNLSDFHIAVHDTSSMSF